MGRDLLMDSLGRNGPGDVNPSAQDLCGVGGREKKGDEESGKCAKKSCGAFQIISWKKTQCRPEGGKAGWGLLLKTGSHPQPHRSFSQADLCRLWGPSRAASAGGIMVCPAEYGGRPHSLAGG